MSLNICGYFILQFGIIFEKIDFSILYDNFRLKCQCGHQNMSAPIIYFNPLSHADTVHSF